MRTLSCHIEACAAIVAKGRCMCVTSSHPMIQLAVVCWGSTHAHSPVHCVVWELAGRQEQCQQSTDAPQTPTLEHEHSLHPNRHTHPESNPLGRNLSQKTTLILFKIVNCLTAFIRCNKVLGRIKIFMEGDYKMPRPPFRYF